MFPAVAAAARIVFAMKPNPRARSHVLSKMRQLFTPQQAGALGDLLQGSLMNACTECRVTSSVLRPQKDPQNSQNPVNPRRIVRFGAKNHPDCREENEEEFNGELAAGREESAWA